MLLDKQIDGYSIGSKASQLFRLIELGVNVPDFLVIPYETICEIKKYKEFKLNDLDANTLNSFLKRIDFPKNSVIVRSSVEGEDGEFHSFSGMMDSILNINTYEGIIQAIQLCVNSAFSERALKYREINNINAEVKPAVIIQLHLNSEISGVIFTKNPMYSYELAIHAVFGQAQALVAGLVEADEYYLLRSHFKLHRKTIRTKDKAHYLLKDEIVNHVLSEDLRDSETINNQLLEELYTTALKLESSIGTSLDIEFVYFENTLFIVQARPITQEIKDFVVLDNSNIQESYNGVVTPLTFSFAQRAYATVYLQTMRALNLPEKTIENHIDVVNNLLYNYKGRIYYNINNWYRGLLLLPSFKKNKSDMEKMMGLNEPVDFIVDKDLNFSSKVKLTLNLILNLFKLFFAFIKLKTSIKNFIHNFEKFHFEFYESIVYKTDLKKLWEIKSRIDTNILNNWTVPIINDFNVMMLNGRVNRMLKVRGIQNPEHYIAQYKFGSEDIASIKQGVELIKLAKTIKSNAQVKNIILEENTNRLNHIKVIELELYNKIIQFIQDYGDRTIGELKLETITMRVNEDVFFNYLKPFLLSEQVENEHVHTIQDDLIQHRFIKKLMLAIQNRELLRLKRTHLFGMYRSIYLKIGENLKSDSIIDSERDIFYLTESEIENHIINKEISLKSIIESRKLEEIKNKNIQVEDRVYLPESISEYVFDINSTDHLHGEYCAGTKVTAYAIVIHEVTDDLNVEGKIIVANRTDPGWISLFPAAAGVLIEKGSSLSHSVILLREMNKPSMINIKGLLRLIKSGDLLEIDPSNGSIKILKNG